MAANAQIHRGNKTTHVRFQPGQPNGIGTMENTPTKPKQAGKKDLQGEGNYDAAREFDADQEAFASDPEKVKRKAREAAEALDSEEGEELREAEEKTGRKGL
jgi:hypothetical protein